MSLKNSLHQHYWFLTQVADALSLKLTGAIFQSAYTLSKGELLLNFKISDEVFQIKIVTAFQTAFMMFDVQTEIQKRSNFQECFNKAFNKKVISINKHAYNRSFELILENEYVLFFKCYDALTNVLLINNKQVLDVFRDDIESDWKYNTKHFLPPPESVIAKLNEVNYLLNNFCICLSAEGVPVLHLNQVLNAWFYTHNALEASNRFARKALAALTFNQQKQNTIQSLQQQINKLQTHITQQQFYLNNYLLKQTEEEKGHLLMANMHLIKPGQEEVELFDFAGSKQVVIKLKRELSVTENATNYFKKAKNKKTELPVVTQKILQLTNKLTQLKQQFNEANNALTAKELKPVYSNQTKKQTVKFKQFLVHNFEILVGKNATNNDLLTQKFAHKNDLWLHAKDVQGSHVVIKHQGGKAIPSQVLIAAAQLAAYYSKHKTQTTAPVSYCLKKYVRKPKGSAPGAVKMEQEEVILVTPKLP